MDALEPSRHFEASSGVRIPRIPGFRAMFDVWNAESVLTYEPGPGSADEGSPLGRWKAALKNHEVELLDVARTFYTYSLMMHFLRRATIDRTFSAHLDIGSGTGLHARYFKGHGVAARSVSLDIRPAKRALSRPLALLLSELGRRHAAARRSATLGAIAARAAGAAHDALFPKLRRISINGAGIDPSGVMADIRRHKRLRRSLAGRAYAYAATFFDPTVRDFLGGREAMFFARELAPIPYRFDLFQDTEEDEYIVGDVFDLSGRFDLITSFYALDYFELDRIFQKVAFLVERGGVFCFLVNYWWYPVNSTKIVGDFPYICQRLSFGELQRYFARFYPDEVEDMKRCYAYFTSEHPLISDYAEAGRRHGLEMVAYQRLRPKYEYDLRLGNRKVGPELAAKLEGTTVGRILQEVKKVRADVEEEDLQTSHVLLAFRRP